MAQFFNIYRPHAKVTGHCKVSILQIKSASCRPFRIDFHLDAGQSIVNFIILVLESLNFPLGKFFELFELTVQLDFVLLNLLGAAAALANGVEHLHTFAQFLVLLDSGVVGVVLAEERSGCHEVRVWPTCVDLRLRVRRLRLLCLLVQVSHRSSHFGDHQLYCRWVQSVRFVCIKWHEWQRIVHFLFRLSVNLSHDQIFLLRLGIKVV